MTVICTKDAPYGRPLAFPTPTTLNARVRARARLIFQLSDLSRGIHVSDNLHRRRSGHHRPADQGEARRRLRPEARQSAARSAQGRGRQTEALWRSRCRDPVPARRGGQRGGASHRRDGRGRAPGDRRVIRPSRRAGLDLWLPGARRGAGGSCRQSEQGQQSGLPRHRRDRAHAPADRRRRARQGRRHLDRLGQRLFGRRQVDDRGL